MNRVELRRIGDIIDRTSQTLEDVATGRRIPDVEAEYQELRLDLATALAGASEALGTTITDPNPFVSLWDWYEFYSKNLGGYAERRAHVHRVYGRMGLAIRQVLQSAADDEMDLGPALLRRLGLPAQGQLSMSVDDFHPRVVEACKSLLVAGHLDQAVLTAFRCVEEDLRARAALGPDAFGVDLVSRVLSSKTPKIRLSEVDAEQEAAHVLFRGAIGFFKNPHSHRSVGLKDQRTAIEQIAFASLLLHLLDQTTRQEIS
jgi:uncharacterized protein (TIGR02391 family)